jgi:hypothetical protein
MPVEEKYVRPMTPAHIRGEEGTDYVEVMFLESARIYHLLKKNPSHGEIVARLHAAISAREPLKIVFASQESDVIEDARRNTT